MNGGIPEPVKHFFFSKVSSFSQAKEESTFPPQRMESGGEVFNVGGRGHT